MVRVRVRVRLNVYFGSTVRILRATVDATSEALCSSNSGRLAFVMVRYKLFAKSSWGSKSLIIECLSSKKCRKCSTTFRFRVRFRVRFRLGLGLGLELLWYYGIFRRETFHENLEIRNKKKNRVTVTVGVRVRVRVMVMVRVRVMVRDGKS